MARTLAEIPLHLNSVLVYRDCLAWKQSALVLDGVGLLLHGGGWAQAGPTDRTEEGLTNAA